MTKVKSGFAFHCHHDTLLEYVYDYDERVTCIKKDKPKAEVELRLKLFQMIPLNRLPPELLEAGEAYNKAQVAYYKAGEDCDWEDYIKAQVAYYKAWEDCLPEMVKLHKELCPNCPWDGKTIFPKEE